MKNVKRIFFKDKIQIPFYEMEDGTIRMPAMIYGQLKWVTDSEFEEIEKKRLERKNKPWYKKIFK